MSAGQRRHAATRTLASGKACRRRSGIYLGRCKCLGWRLEEVGQERQAAQRRPGAALDDLAATAEGWRDLYIDNPAMASWRSAAVAAHAALGHPEQAAALASEQLALARKTGNPVTIGTALRAHAAVACDHPEESLSEAVSLLEPTLARHELALMLADLGTHLRRAGRRSDAQAPLRRALERRAAGRRPRRQRPIPKAAASLSIDRAPGIPAGPPP
jgi:hypothetical protein